MGQDGNHSGRSIIESKAGMGFEGGKGYIGESCGLLGGEAAGGVLEVRVPSCELVLFSSRRVSSCLLFAALFELGSLALKT